MPVACVGAHVWQVGRRSRASTSSEQFTPRTRRLRVEAGPPLNWPLLWHAFAEDHTRPDLLWNQRTREKLREAMRRAEALENKARLMVKARERRMMALLERTRQRSATLIQMEWKSYLVRKATKARLAARGRNSGDIVD